ncbi:MAG: alpha/beta hydrolase [bacterium]|nr:alpha/beta hydrolase [bacterium]
MTVVTEMHFKHGKPDPQVSSLLDIINQADPPDYSKINFHEFKKTANKLFNDCYKAKVYDRVEKVDDLLIDGPETRIPIRIYTPSENGPFSIFLYLHGGGWMTGNLDTHDNICRAFCKRAECLVVAVDYRLTPENKFPAGFNDVCTVFEWIVDSIDSYNGNPNAVGVGGDSGGGTMAAALAVKYNKKTKYNIVFQMLCYPSLNIASFNTGSYHEFKEGYGLSKEKVEWYVKNCFADDKDKYNIYASPLLNEEMEGLPPAYIITAEYDVLRDDGEQYAQKLDLSGVSVRCIRYGGLIHAFLNMDGIIDKVDTVFSELADIVKSKFKETINRHKVREGKI